LRFKNDSNIFDLEQLDRMENSTNFLECVKNQTAIIEMKMRRSDDIIELDKKIKKYQKANTENFFIN